MHRAPEGCRAAPLRRRPAPAPAPAPAENRPQRPPSPTGREQAAAAPQPNRPRTGRSGPPAQPAENRPQRPPSPTGREQAAAAPQPNRPRTGRSGPPAQPAENRPQRPPSPTGREQAAAAPQPNRPRTGRSGTPNRPGPAEPNPTWPGPGAAAPAQPSHRLPLSARRSRSYRGPGPARSPEGAAGRFEPRRLPYGGGATARLCAGRRDSSGRAMEPLRLVALLLLFLLLLLVPLGLLARRRHGRRTPPLRLLVVAGSGGHTTEILRLLSCLSESYSPRHYIFANSDKMSEAKIRSFEQKRAETFPNSQFTLDSIPRSREVRQSWTSSVVTTLHSMLYSLHLTCKWKPDLVVRLGIMLMETTTSKTF
ncbi:UDP-N-acetylglucosamine transferase subunit ALG14 homolog isoform X3 [Falco cherrug]|uniref:UDP-N-acetylglucosamine transferase subunit ALG14 homolog isoform X3 n=1 Tax=Falco cherrug TaxID=345164 RepID=UPI002479C3F6|nr:UDP-N-acetylglucosamine transferase subunit ALG14 homolog isoform X3 [Falco cherrug]